MSDDPIVPLWVWLTLFFFLWGVVAINLFALEMWP